MPEETPNYASQEELAKVAKGNAALQTQLSQVAGAINVLASQTQQTPEETPAPEPPKYTRGQLNQAVAEGKISQSEADDIWDVQRREEIKEEVTKDVKQTLEVFAAENSLDTEIQQYARAVPSLKHKGSKERQAVEAEYAELVGMGMKEGDLQTELLALRNVYGPPERLQSVRARRPESWQGTNAGGQDVDDKGDQTGIPRGLTSKQRRYYQSQIDRGVNYKSWDDVKKDLNFKRK